MARKVYIPEGVKADLARKALQFVKDLQSECAKGTKTPDEAGIEIALAARMDRIVFGQPAREVWAAVFEAIEEAV